MKWEFIKQVKVFYRRHRLLIFIKKFKIFEIAYAISEKDIEKALKFAMSCLGFDATGTDNTSYFLILLMT